MRLLYSILYTLGFVLLSPSFLYKMWKRGKYKENFLQRFGRYSPELRQRRPIAAAPEATGLEVAATRGMVYAARSEGHAIAVVAGRGALPALMLYDLRMLLAEMDRTL